MTLSIVAVEGFSMRTLNRCKRKGRRNNFGLYPGRKTSVVRTASPKPTTRLPQRNLYATGTPLNRVAIAVDVIRAVGLTCEQAGAIIEGIGVARGAGSFQEVQAGLGVCLPSRTIRLAGHCFCQP